MLEAKIDMLRANLEEARKSKPEASADIPSATGSSATNPEIEAELIFVRTQAAEFQAQSALLQQQHKSAERAAKNLKAKASPIHQVHSLYLHIYVQNVCCMSMCSERIVAIEMVLI